MEVVYVGCKSLPAVLKKLGDYMTELCNTCLGCQQMEREDFNGVHRCPGWRDSREPEGQIEMEVEDGFQ